MNEICKNGLSCTVDWVSFTLFNISIDDVLENLGFCPYDLESRYGTRGYKSMYANELGFSILYDGEKNQGIHVDIPSKVLYEFIEHLGYVKYSARTPFGGVAHEFAIDILRHLIEFVKAHGHFTRFDIAVDDLKGYYSVADVWHILKSEMYVGNFRKFEHYESRVVTGECVGETVYMGSRQSNFYLRVYDKQLEQNVDYLWVRWELEIKNECADLVAERLLADPLPDVVFGTLSNFVRFIKDDATRKCRCSTSEIWLDFLNNMQSMSYRIERHEPTLEDKEEWIERQVMPSICALMLANGGSLDFIENKIVQSSFRMSESLKRRLYSINPDWEQLLYYME